MRAATRAEGGRSLGFESCNAGGGVGWGVGSLSSRSERSDISASEAKEVSADIGDSGGFGASEVMGRLEGGCSKEYVGDSRGDGGRGEAGSV